MFCEVSWSLREYLAALGIVLEFWEMSWSFQNILEFSECLEFWEVSWSFGNCPVVLGSVLEF